MPNQIQKLQGKIKFSNSDHFANSGVPQAAPEYFATFFFS